MSVLLASLASVGLAGASTTESILVDGLTRAMDLLADRDDSPYYVAAAVEDRTTIAVTGESGTLSRSDVDRARYLDVDLRVGDPALDSTRPLRGFSALEGEGRGRLAVALDDGYALRHALWREVDRRYRESAERLVMVRANLSVKVEEESPADDFEPRPPSVAHLDTPPLEVDVPAWEGIVARISARLDAHPHVHTGVVSMEADRVVKTWVDVDGARLVHGRTHGRVALQVESTADDGDVVSVYVSRDVHAPDRDQVTEAELGRWADAAVERLVALRDAPRGDPYSGPVILRGRATGVFFHEVFGHRVEGHRQKSEDEGKTFAEQVGKQVLPRFLDVFDDPTLATAAGVDLNGHYAYDDEGVPAARADLVEDGVFVGFLTGRSPIEGFPRSNGHGRRSAGNPPTPRMGNTVVTSSRAVSDDRLRELLLAELKAQGQPYGYIVEEIDGGFTLTGRVTPNAFNVRASATWRVHADGRPDELVRGIDLVGTPLVAFGNLVATGDTPEVFNGVCGAESGWVPVSAVAPSILFSRLEFQLKEKGQERPPLLPKPLADQDGSADGEAR